MAAAAAKRASSHLLRLSLVRSQYTAFPTRTASGLCESGVCPSRYKTKDTFSSFPATPLSMTNYRANMISQKRWASHAAATKSAVGDSKLTIGPQSRDVERNDADTGIVYYGPISNTIKKVKLLSLSTCCLSVSLGPVITFMTSPEMNVILKGGVASTVIFLSASTTAALHWFVSPYVHRLRWQPGSDSFDVEMMSWLATLVPRKIKFADIRPAETQRPFVTFKANDNFYFVDVEHCNNKALLQKLTPKPVQSAFKNI